jgi:hypothetical protein
LGYALIILCFYGILTVYDFYPKLKSEDKKSLRFSIPVYIITLLLNLTPVFGIKFTSITKMWEIFLSPIVK